MGFSDKGVIFPRNGLSTGDIERAEETIRVLKLDDLVLVEQRERLIKSVENEYLYIFEGTDSRENLDQDKLNLVEAIRRKEFQTAVLDAYNLNDQ